MLIRIGEFDITECWDGVFYKKLSRYPEITAYLLIFRFRIFFQLVS